ncbi:MAG: hypothetical protein ABJH08_02175 [Balneola sp.]
MKFDRFKELHEKYDLVHPQTKEQDTEEFENYLDAFYENKLFSNWVLERKLEDAGFDYSYFCCLTMANHVFNSFDEDGEIKNSDADVIINKWKDGTYGIPIHDGGASVIKINYCPWCGLNLKDDE